MTAVLSNKNNQCVKHKPRTTLDTAIHLPIDCLDCSTLPGLSKLAGPKTRTRISDTMRPALP